MSENGTDMEVSQEDLPALNVVSDAADNSGNNSVDNDSSQAFLILDNDADKEYVHIGEKVIWMISVINIGPDAARNVKVYDPLPDGLEYVSHTTSKGTFDPETGIWLIDILTVEDGQVYLDITTRALTLGEKINTAYLTSSTYNLNMNNSYEEEEIDVVSDSVEHEIVSKSVNSDTSTGNPIALFAISLFVILCSFVWKGQ